MPNTKEAPKWNFGSIWVPKEKISFRGTAQKSALQQGFRECKGQIAECTIG
jgi:hypothetical protein